MKASIKLEPLLISADDAAKMLGVSRSFFYEMLSSGRCPVRPVQFSKRRLWRVDLLMAWVQSGCRADWRPKNE
ncbi:MAG: helix-turn-helix domain-containing protein [Planctomycetes bacterium]|nr:helix-turn-helix domain-containing protein [Planctomycetota bacterium]